MEVWDILAGHLDETKLISEIQNVDLVCGVREVEKDRCERFNDCRMFSIRSWQRE